MQKFDRTQFLLQQRVAKKAARKRNAFCIHYFSKKKKRKPVKKKDKCFPISLLLIYQNLGKSDQKKKNGQKFDIRQLCRQPFNWALYLLRLVSAKCRVSA